MLERCAGLAAASEEERGARVFIEYYSTGGEGEAGIINQAEDRETRIHSFEVTMAFYGK